MKIGIFHDEQLNNIKNGTNEHLLLFKAYLTVFFLLYFISVTNEPQMLGYAPLRYGSTRLFLGPLAGGSAQLRLFCSRKLSSCILVF